MLYELKYFKTELVDFLVTPGYFVTCDGRIQSFTSPVSAAGMSCTICQVWMFKILSNRWSDS